MQGEGTSLSPLPAVPPGLLVAPAPVRPVVKKEKWRKHEDAVPRQQMHLYGENWHVVCRALDSRTGKSCRDRWAKLRKTDAAALENLSSAAAAVDDEPPRKQARLLELLPLASGGIARGAHAMISLVEEEIAESSGADHGLLSLFPMSSGDIIRGADARPAPSFDDGKDDPLTVLRLGPSPSPVLVHDDAIPMQAVPMH